LLLMTALAVGTASPVAAAESAEAREARAHYRKGEEAFKAGRFEEAFQEWQQGYRLSNRPLFLLNMAHAQRRRGELSSARALYQRFLLIEPQSKLRDEIEGVLAEIDETLAAQPGGLERAPAEPVAPVSPPAAAPSTPTTPAAVAAADPPAPIADLTPTAPPPLSVPPPSPPPAPFGRIAPPALADTAPAPASPPPIYKRWWFWSGIGVLVAGGLGAAFVLRSEPYTRHGSLGTIGGPP
jgi:hypothetical protein